MSIGAKPIITSRRLTLPARLTSQWKGSMQEYDAALKLLLQGSARRTMRELTGTDVLRWLDVELPKVQNLRLDLLGETAGGDLVHLELQSTNEAVIPLRM